MSVWLPTERDLGLWLLLSIIVFIPLWFWRYRRLVSQLFAGREGDQTALQEMRQKLEGVNEECPTHLFSAERVARVYPHEYPMSLAYGYVMPRIGKGGSQKCVFAIADRDQADWMRLNSDVFEPAFAGSRWSIFWVKVPALLSLVKGR